MGFWNKWFKDDIKELLTKSEADAAPDIPEEPRNNKDDIGRQSLIYDPNYDNYGNTYLHKYKPSRLSNKTLKDVSLRDWLVSSIINNRCNTLSRFGRPQINRFDFGFKVVKKDKNKPITSDEKTEIKVIEDFLYHCGRTNNVPDEDKMLLNDFLNSVTRDALTFGHIAIEKIKTRSGGLHRFRPVPAESVYLVNKNADKKMLQEHVNNVGVNKFLSENDPEKNQKINKAEVEYYKYIQMSDDNRPLALFGSEDMVFKLFGKQNFSDSRGYCYSPLEMAIVNITNHMNVEHYNANFFTHGYAARGLLHLKGTLTPSQLTAFRRQFYNTITGTQNAWRTPIVAGLDDVQWVPMSGSAREMEYINFNNHLLRSVCTQFQIDPTELGLDFLTSGSGKSPSGSESNESKIIFSRERGLYPLITFFEDFFNNDILSVLNPEYNEKYSVKFVGHTDETPQSESALLQAEMSLYASMNDLLSKSEKEQIKEDIANVPLNQSFWELVEKNYTRGEIREKFFKDKGASERLELQYIPGDPAFLSWQQMILTMKQEKEQQQQAQQQAEAEAAEQEKQSQREEEAHQRDQEVHDATMEDREHAKAHAAVTNRSLQDIAKETGATKANIINGTPTKNPLGHADEL